MGRLGHNRYPRQAVTEVTDTSSNTTTAPGGIDKALLGGLLFLALFLVAVIVGIIIFFSCYCRRARNSAHKYRENAAGLHRLRKGNNNQSGAVAINPNLRSQNIFNNFVTSKSHSGNQATTGMMSSSDLDRFHQRTEDPNRHSYDNPAYIPASVEKYLPANVSARSYTADGSRLREEAQYSERSVDVHSKQGKPPVSPVPREHERTETKHPDTKRTPDDPYNSPKNVQSPKAKYQTENGNYEGLRHETLAPKNVPYEEISHVDMGHGVPPLWPSVNAAALRTAADSPPPPIAPRDDVLADAAQESDDSATLTFTQNSETISEMPKPSQGQTFYGQPQAEPWAHKEGPMWHVSRQRPGMEEDLVLESNIVYESDASNDMSTHDAPKLVHSDSKEGSRDKNPEVEALQHLNSVLDTHMDSNRRNSKVHSHLPPLEVRRLPPLNPIHVKGLGENDIQGKKARRHSVSESNDKLSDTDKTPEHISAGRQRSGSVSISKSRRDPNIVLTRSSSETCLVDKGKDHHKQSELANNNRASARKDNRRRNSDFGSNQRDSVRSPRRESLTRLSTAPHGHGAEDNRGHPQSSDQYERSPKSGRHQIRQPSPHERTDNDTFHRHRSPSPKLAESLKSHDQFEMGVAIHSERSEKLKPARPSSGKSSNRQGERRTREMSRQISTESYRVRSNTSTTHSHDSDPDLENTSDQQHQRINQREKREHRHRHGDDNGRHRHNSSQHRDNSGRHGEHRGRSTDKRGQHGDDSGRHGAHRGRSTDKRGQNGDDSDFGDNKGTKVEGYQDGHHDSRHGSQKENHRSRRESRDRRDESRDRRNEGRGRGVEDNDRHSARRDMGHESSDRHGQNHDRRSESRESRRDRQSVSTEQHSESRDKGHESRERTNENRQSRRESRDRHRENKERQNVGKEGRSESRDGHLSRRSESRERHREGRDRRSESRERHREARDRRSESRERHREGSHRPDLNKDRHHRDRDRRHESRERHALNRDKHSGDRKCVEDEDRSGETGHGDGEQHTRGGRDESSDRLGENTNLRGGARDRRRDRVDGHRPQAESKESHRHRSRESHRHSERSQRRHSESEQSQDNMTMSLHGQDELYQLHQSARAALDQPAAVKEEQSERSVRGRSRSRDRARKTDQQ